MSLVDRIASEATAGVDTWNDLVDESPQGNIFCRTWWLEAVCPEGYDLVQVMRDGRIAAGMAVPWARTARGRSIRMPRLTQTLGPLLRPAGGIKYETRLSAEMELLRELVDRLPDCDEFSINCHHRLGNWLPFYWAGYSQTTRYTYVFDDLSDLGAIYDGMSAKTRNIIRKAEKTGITVAESDDLDSFLRLLSMTFSRQGMALPYTQELLRKLDRACLQHDARKILIARDKTGVAHAAIYLAYDAQCVYYLMQGTDPALRASGAALLAQWCAIRLASKLAPRYDFEGSMIESVEHVFRSFGAVQRPYFHIFRQSANPSLRDVAMAAYRYARSRLKRRAK